MLLSQNIRVPTQRKIAEKKLKDVKSWSETYGMKKSFVPSTKLNMWVKHSCYKYIYW